ncbi:MAG: hypothetical protein HOW73_50350 [Polyangiaceae bacterium]|nr:hypothetical protein [Polyangiaceae bacterium]
MKNVRAFVSILLATVAFAPAIASADDADKAACADLDEGDECTRGDGDPGFCIPDESDANVLTCDDDRSAGGTGGSSAGDDNSSGAGCSASSGAANASGAILVALAGLGISAARRRRAPDDQYMS